jgi:hypothetical protein
MQARISHGPHVALGLDGSGATPQAVRTAFLNLTKQFHPARFGRMSNELQRLSNEVFLGIKSAHETMLRSLGVVGRGGGRLSSQVMPVLTIAEGTNKTAQPKPQRAVGTQPQEPQPALPRTLTPTKHGVGMTPPFGTRVTAQRPGTPPQTRPGTPPQTSRPGTPPSTRPSTPNVGAPPKPVTVEPQTHRGTGEWQPTKVSPAFDERAELQLVLDALVQKNWGAAKALLNGLAARVPTSKQYRALIAYTRGREAQIAGRNEDAVMEYERALQIDPDNQQAKSAKAELLKRR